MNRRDFLKAGAASLSIGMTETTMADAETATSPDHPRPEPTSLSIRDYLSREARHITDNSLRDFRDAATWRRLLPGKRRQLIEMMGLQDLPVMGKRDPVPVNVTGTVDRPAYRIEKLSYESLPGLFVTANLYVPKNTNGRAPGVLYVCGHAGDQKVHYQAHPRRLAELGFVCLIAETVQLGEVQGYHHGPYREGWFHWYSRGYTPAGIELWNGIRGLDLLAQRSDVDATNLGVTGISGGGATSWWIAAADERVKVSAPVCGTATLESHIQDRTIDGHCDCMWWNNLFRWDLADVGALIAPRPLMIASADRDGIFTIASIRKVHEQLKGQYGKLGASDNLRLIETPGPHSYHERSRTAIFSFFLKHLQGKDVPPDHVGDADESPASKESVETLKVYVNGFPAGNKTSTIHDDLYQPPQPPTIDDERDLKKARQRIVQELREKTFGHFPAPPAPLDLRIEYEFAAAKAEGCRFAFTPEEGWRLHGQLTPMQAGKHPAVVALRMPGEERNAAEQLAGRIRAPWARVVVETRGTGDTAWGEELQWHVRRAAAWTGRTIASMRVLDTLRALEAVRQLPQVDPEQVCLAARGEMAVVALYTALLDGKVKALFLEDPPLTQNAASRKDGRGEAIEMLHCLRISDLDQVAGLLYPTEIVLTGAAPEGYAWTEEQYKKLGLPGRFTRVKSLADWKEAS
jgi:cephalosporin-C deacetylase-like acetyl esterase